MILRDYQAEAIERLRDSLKTGHKHPVLQAPTGAGKTMIAASVVNMALQKRRRVVFTVPALSLIDQTVERFWEDGITDVGVIQADHPMTNWAKPVQIASVSTLAQRGYPECDLVIVDECHVVFKHYAKWMSDRPELPFIGLSATPWTKGLGKLYDDLIIATTTRELIERGELSPFNVYAPAHPDLSGVKTIAGDYHEGQLSEAMNKQPLVADVVETWVKLGENRPTLVFAVDRAHAKHLQQQFQAAGINAAYQDMATSDGDRAAIRRGFAAGQHPVVVNIGTLTTGVDWDVRCIVLARPTRSEILYVQCIGRGLRRADGKDCCKILDHSDTTLRLGFVTDINHDSLDAGTKGNGSAERKPPLPKECSNCHYLRPPRSSVCPACGHKAEAPQNLIAHEEGELVEYAGGKAQPLDKTANGHILNGVAIAGHRVPQREFYAELRGHAEARGFKPGWALNQYREKVGEWPPRAWNLDEAASPSPEVASWIKSRMIAFAKRRGRDAT